LAMAYNNLGVAYIFLAKYDRAITYLDKTLKVDPYYSLAYNNLGLAFYYMGQYPQAISNYETCLKIDPNYSIAHSNLGLVYAALGNDNQALACYNRALELSPDDVETFANRAQTFLHLRQYDNAWEDVHQAEALGAKIDSKFIAGLKSASGRNK
ncbi:MAG: tetratricopeptide repeat protein, partial [Candidatus Omnitrophota bacterium]